MEQALRELLEPIPNIYEKVSTLCLKEIEYIVLCFTVMLNKILKCVVKYEYFNEHSKVFDWYLKMYYDKGK